MGNENSKLAEESGLQPDDIEVLREKYENLCTTPQGLKKELTVDQFCSKVAIGHRSLAEVVFHAMDYDRKGIISFRSFVLAVAILAKGTFEEKADFLFTVYDKDNKGQISVVDMKRMVGVFKKSSAAIIYQMTNVINPPIHDEEIAQQIFRHMDFDNSGNVSREEFHRFWKEFPSMVSQVEQSFNMLKQASLWDWEKVSIRTRASPSITTCTIS